MAFDGPSPPSWRNIIGRTELNCMTGQLRLQASLILEHLNKSKSVPLQTACVDEQMNEQHSYRLRRPSLTVLMARHARPYRAGLHRRPHVLVSIVETETLGQREVSARSRNLIPTHAPSMPSSHHSLLNAPHELPKCPRKRYKPSRALNSFTDVPSLRTEQSCRVQ